MKILYLSGYLIPSRKAHSVHVMKMCQAFARNGHKTTLICKKYEYSRNQDIFDFYGVDKNFQLVSIPCQKIRGSSILLLPKLYKILKAHDPKDVLIYARDIYGALLADKLGFKIVYEAHWPPPNRLIRRLERSLYAGKGFRKLIVISESLKRIYLSIFGRITYIDVCHDAADMPSVDTNLDYSWPCKRDRLQVGYTGHLCRGRGIEIILQCASRLPQYDFHIVGGMDEDIEYWRQYGGINVYFHGFIRPLLIPIVLKKCDVLLMPYQKGLAVVGESIDTSEWMSPMKLFEYMASCRVIVASDLPVLREILSVNNSILVTPDNTDDWVSSIRLCENPDYRNRLSKAAYEQFLSNYTWDRRAIKTLEDIEL